MWDWTPAFVIILQAQFLSYFWKVSYRDLQLVLHIIYNWKMHNSHLCMLNKKDSWYNLLSIAILYIPPRKYLFFICAFADFSCLMVEM